MTNQDLETKVINKFVTKNKRDRCIGFIKRDATRFKFISELSTRQIFDDKVLFPIQGHEDDVIKAIAKKLEVKDCYIISENKTVDGRRLDIDEAINIALSPWSDTTTLLVFGDAEIIYVEREGLKNRFVSQM